jgi:ATP synthase subunit 6
MSRQFIYLFSPLEQFEVLSFVLLSSSFPIIHLTNLMIIFYVSIGFLFFFLELMINNLLLSLTLRSFLQAFIEISYISFLSLFFINAGKKKDNFIPFYLTVCLTIFFCNILGIMPFGQTLTAHIIITFNLSFILFISINLLGITTHGLKFFSLFLPQNTPFILLPILFLIELVGYVVRMFSLSIRLFSNMMAGHTLLKILVTFLFSSFKFGGIFILINIIPIIIIHLVILIEVGVALLQVYVFYVLSCFYLKDTIDLHN